MAEPGGATSSRRARRHSSGRSRTSSPPSSSRSKASSTTGTSARIFGPSTLRPMRRCICAKGSGRPSCHGSTSPSSTVPSGNCAPEASISGKRSVTSSSPRDQRNVRQSRRMSWERMPSHFHSTCHSARAPRSSTGALERVGEAERVGAADIGVLRFGGDERGPEIGRGLPVAHEAVGDGVGVHAAHLGQRAHHQALRNADAPLAGDDLVPGEALGLIHGAPGLDERFAPRGVVLIAQRQQALFDPVMQRQVAGFGGGRQQERHGFGEVAHGVVALAEEPVRDAGLLDGPRGELARFDEALGAAADQEVQRPDGIGRAARSKSSA